jgi:sigma-E factor negative regulatory protein RseB
MKRHIPDSAFKPEISTEGFRWLRNDGGPSGPALTEGGMPVLWDAVKLPPGFRMSARGAQVMPGSEDPVAHLVFTDGIASVSVFVESHASGDSGHPQSGTAQVGSSSAFSTVIEGHQVTAVGEVPPRTVRFIVESVKVQSSESPAPPLSPPVLSLHH